MNETPIPTVNIQPSDNGWAGLTAAPETHAVNRAYANPWLLRFYDDEISLELINQSLEEKRFVQVYMPNESRSFASAPQKVLPGHSVYLHLKGVSDALTDFKNNRFYVRWVDKTGVSLVWPISW